MHTLNEGKLYTHLGIRIRHRRRKLKMSQQELSEGIFDSRASICQIENGKQRILLHDLFSIAKKLNCSVNYLLPI